MKNILKKNIEVKEIIEEVAQVADFLWQRGWAERNAGNISVNIDEFLKDTKVDLEEFPKFELNKSFPELANMFFLVTGTGKRMRDLARKPMKNVLLIKITEEGNAYHLISRLKDQIENFRPTSELPTHLGIHQLIAQRNTNEKVILHTHANELIALTQSPEMKSAEVINNLIWGMHPESMVFIPKGIGFVPYILPGTQKIADETLKILEHHDIVLWEKHGVFAIGESVFDTFDNIDIVSKSVKIWFMCKSAGFTPEGLDEAQLKELEDLAKTF